MGALDSQLDVLRVMIDAPDDDEILEAPAEEQLLVLEEAQIAGAQERPVAGVRQPGAESRVGVGRPIPIAGGDPWTANPDLPHLTRPARGQGLGVDDDDVGLGDCRSAPREHLRLVLFRRCRRRHQRVDDGRPGGLLVRRFEDELDAHARFAFERRGVASDHPAHLQRLAERGSFESEGEHRARLRGRGGEDERAMDRDVLGRALRRGTLALIRDVEMTGRPWHGHDPTLEPRSLKRADDGLLSLGAAGDDERRLRQAVARVDRLWPETARREPLREALDGLGPHRLGAVEGDLPGAEIEAPDVLVGHLAGAQVVGEVRTAARGPAPCAHGLEPAEGALQERQG